MDLNLIYLKRPGKSLKYRIRNQYREKTALTIPIVEELIAVYREAVGKGFSWLQNHQLHRGICLAAPRVTGKRISLTNDVYFGTFSPHFERFPTTPAYRLYYRAPGDSLGESPSYITNYCIIPRIQLLKRILRDLRKHQNI